MQKLDDSDILTLKSCLWPSSNDKIVFTYMIIFSPLIPLLIGFLSNIKNSDEIVFKFNNFVWIIPLSLLLLIILTSRFINRKIRLDIEEGLKNRQVGKITKLSKTKISSYAYKGILPQQMIAGSHMEYKVKVGKLKGMLYDFDFNNLEVDDNIEIYFAPNSKIILSLVK